MGIYDIDFPNLGIYLSNVPKTFTVFGFEIALYGVTMACAIMAGILMATHVAKITGQNPDLYWDAAIYLIVFCIIGSRIYYVAFMWDYYKDNLLQIFNLRAGGIAMYGTVIAAMITTVVYCKVKKANPAQLLDTVACGLLLGQVIGRWGNFFNREVFGDYTDGLFAMRLPVEMVRQRDISENIAAHMDGVNYIQVHPTFLYEGVWNFCLMLILLLVIRKKWNKFHGEIWLMYLAGYGIGRAMIEYIRTDQLYIPNTKIPVSLVVGLVSAAAAIVISLLVRSSLKKGNHPNWLAHPDKEGSGVIPEEAGEAAGAETEEAKPEEKAAGEEKPEEKGTEGSEQEKTTEGTPAAESPAEEEASGNDPSAEQTAEEGTEEEPEPEKPAEETQEADLPSKESALEGLDLVDLDD